MTKISLYSGTLQLHILFCLYIIFNKYIYIYIYSTIHCQILLNQKKIRERHCIFLLYISGLMREYIHVLPFIYFLTHFYNRTSHKSPYINHEERRNWRLRIRQNYDKTLVCEARWVVVLEVMIRLSRSTLWHAPRKTVEHVPITKLSHSIRNLRSNYTIICKKRAVLIANDRSSLTVLFDTIIFFKSLFFNSLSFFSFPPLFSTPQHITHLTGFYFVCVFPCYLPCRRQMGTKSRQRKVIFEFSHKIACGINFFFFSSTCMQSAWWHVFPLSGI